MRISKREFGHHAATICKWADDGKVSQQKADELVNWGWQVLDHLDDTINVEVPTEFLALIGKCRKSYLPDADALLLDAEQRAKPSDYQPPTNKTYDKTIMRDQLLQKLDDINGNRKAASERIEFARRGSSESDLLGALCRSARWNRKIRQDYIQELIMADPFQKNFWSGFVKVLAFSGRGLSAEEREAVNRGLVWDDGKGYFQKSLTAGASPGTLWLAEDVAEAVFDICPLWGVYTTFRVIQLAKGRSKFVKVTALPLAWWLIPDQRQGSTLPVDTTLGGAAISVECNTLGVNIEVSIELLQDERVDWGTALLEKIARALACALDSVALAGNGTADIVNGGQIGIFKHTGVPVVQAASGHSALNVLDHADLMKAAAAIALAGLQRECRFWVSPAFLPQLLLVKDGSLFLCQTPAQSPTGEFTLAGFPMSLSIAAPSVDGAGLPVAAFGWGDAYTIAMRLDAEVATGEPRWNQALKNIRALTRARCEMGAPEMFSILKLATS